MATATRTVYVRSETLDILSAIARDSGRPLADVLDDAAWELLKKRFFEGLNADYERLQADTVLWQEELEERALWDCTLMDDLHDDPYPMEAMLTEEERLQQTR